MRITEITEDDGIYIVTLVPNKLEKFLGVKEKIKRFKDSGQIYSFSGRTVYINEDGEEVPNGDWICIEIDKWRRKF